MTIIGPDLSSYQRGLVLSEVPNASFVIAKTSEGTYFTDDTYPGFRTQTSALGLPFIWYHLVSAEPAAGQVAHTLANVGDPNLPGMIDCEPSGNRPAPTWADIKDYVTAALTAGLNLRLVYLPHWFWQDIGSPNLGWLTNRGLRLVSSDYTGPGLAGEYAGDSAVGWEPYGGVTPVIWQYTDTFQAPGMALDMNAYRGTPDQLRAILAPRQENDMATTFATGQVNTGTGAKTVICPPPANTGTNWRNVWISFGADFGTAHLRVAAYIHGTGWRIFDDFQVGATGDRVNPFGGAAPAGIQTVSITRITGSEYVPVGWLIEAQSA